ncbi:MAG: hypothetical protein R2794_04020 [Chitinophagales bacterium]
MHAQSEEYPDWCYMQVWSEKVMSVDTFQMCLPEKGFSVQFERKGKEFAGYVINNDTSDLYISRIDQNVDGVTLQILDTSGWRNMQFSDSREVICGNSFYFYLLKPSEVAPFSFAINEDGDNEVPARICVLLNDTLCVSNTLMLRMPAERMHYGPIVAPTRTGARWLVDLYKQNAEYYHAAGDLDRACDEYDMAHMTWPFDQSVISACDECNTRRMNKIEEEH